MSTTVIPVKPAFDPNKPFTPADGGKPAFDPDKPFTEAKEEDTGDAIDKAHAQHGKEALDQLTLDKKMREWGVSQQQTVNKQDATYVRHPLPLFRTAEQKTQDATEFQSQPGADKLVTARIASNHPEIANDLKAAQLTRNIQTDPVGTHDLKKAKENIEAVKKGDLDFNIKTGQLQKPLGLGESIAYGWEQRQKALSDYEDLTKLSDAEIAKKFNTEPPRGADDPVPTPAAHGFGTYASMIGSEGVATSKAIVAGGVTAAIPGLEEFAPAAAALAASPEYYKRAYANKFREAYTELKQKGVPDLDAVAKARDQAQYSAELSVMQGAAMTAAGVRLGTAGVEGATLGQKVTNAAKTVFKEGSAYGALGAGMQGAENVRAGKVTSEGMLEAFKSGAEMPLALGAIIKGAHEIPTAAFKKVVQGTAKVPIQDIHTELGHMVMDQSITPEQAKTAAAIVANQKVADASIPDNITADEKRQKIQDAMAERDQLAKEAEGVHESLQPAYKQKLKEADENIANMVGLTNKTTPDAVSKQGSAKVHVQPAPDNSSEVGGGDESKGAVDKEPAAEKVTTKKVNNETTKTTGGTGEPGDSDNRGSQKEKETTEDIDAAAQRDAALKHSAPGRVAADDGAVTRMRHATSVDDTNNVVSGQSQTPLTPEAKEQEIPAAIQELKDNGIKPTEVHTSDLERAHETGAAIAEEFGAKHVVNKDLRSWDLKDFGKTDEAEFKPVQKWFVDHPDELKYGGDIEKFKGKTLGESFNDYKDRAVKGEASVPPGSLHVGHSNNLTLNDAINHNGGWNDAAKEEYVNAKSPEPASIIHPREEVATADAVEQGKISDEDLTKNIKDAILEHVPETKEKPAGTVHGTSGEETSGVQPDKTSGRTNETKGDENGVSKNGAKPGTVPGSEGAPDKAVSDYEKQVKKVFARVGERSEDTVPMPKAYADPKSALQSIKEEHPDNELFQNTATFLEKALSNNKKIKIENVPGLTDEHGNKSLGLYNRETKQIQVDFSAHPDTEAAHQTILHELLHGATSSELLKDGSFQQEIRKQLEVLRDAFADKLKYQLPGADRAVPVKGFIGDKTIPSLVAGQKISEHMYGLTNEHELLSELHTNKTFRDMVSEIPAPDNPKQNMLQRIFTNIVKFFNRKYGIKNSISATDMADYLTKLTEGSLTPTTGKEAEGVGTSARLKGAAQDEYDKIKQLGKLAPDAMSDAAIRNMIGQHSSLPADVVETAIKDGRQEQANETALKEKTKALNMVDNWEGSKRWNRIESEVRAREFQKAIKATAVKGQNWRDIDRAIHVYNDIRGLTPEEVASQVKDINPKTHAKELEILDKAKNLTPEQKKIADRIKDEYEKVGAFSKEKGIIQNVLENYVNRSWDIPNKFPINGPTKFATSTRHSMQRTLGSVLEGWGKGLHLTTEGASNNLQQLELTMKNVAEDQRLLQKGSTMKVSIPQSDGTRERVPLFTTNQEPGFEKINSPSFQKWSYVNKLEDYEAQNGVLTGKRKDIMVTPEGTVMQKNPVYAPEYVAKSLNNILDQSVLNKIPGVAGITKFNAEVKKTILSANLFHYVAFARAHELAGSPVGSMPILNTIQAYKRGIGMIHESLPELQDLVKDGGMTLTRGQDFKEGVQNHQTWLGKQMDKVGATKYVKDKVLQFNEAAHHTLFETYGAGLKAYDGVNLLRDRLAANPNADRLTVLKEVGKALNDSYGGINWNTMHGSAMQNPSLRHGLSLAFLAPDWTASNLRFFKNQFKGGMEGQVYRKMAAKVVLRGVTATLVANSLMALADDKDDDGNQLSWWESMERRYSKAWDAGKLRSAMIDITPLYHWAGGDESKRAYFSLFGAYLDPIKLAGSPNLDAVSNVVQGKFTDIPKIINFQNTENFFNNKSSPISRTAVEFWSGSNWQQRPFTNLDELLGMDDKGAYEKTTKGHSKGDFNPATGKYYKKSEETHVQGEAKGGKFEGMLTRPGEAKGHGLSTDQMPSFFLSQARQMMPIAGQNVLQGMQGENDWAASLANAIGLQVLTNKDPDQK